MQVRNFINWNRSYALRLAKAYPALFGSPSYKSDLLSLINAFAYKEKPRRILEAGGIDRPLLEKGQGFVYDGLDIEERQGCYRIYDNFLVQSVEEPISAKEYDCIASIALLEHAPDNDASINNIYAALTPGGATFHYIPSKWHPYSIALRILGSKLQKQLIPLLRPGKESVTGYPAYFDYCSPAAMRQLFVKAGFENVMVKTYYRANDYFAFFCPALCADNNL